MSIYVDVIFLINLVMNTIILLLTAWIADIKYKGWRIVVSAMIGSSYVVVTMLPNSLFLLQHFFFKMIIALLLLLIAFGFQSRRTMLLLIAFFYIVSFLLGGAVVGWFYFWQTNDYENFDLLALKKLSWLHLLCGGVIGILLIRGVMRCMLVSMTRHNYLYQVRLEYEGRQSQLTAMVDTGNGLYTVIGRKPVILVCQRGILPLLSQPVKLFLENHSPDLWLSHLHQCTDMTWLAKVQCIPYHSIGHNGVLLAFPIDHFIIIGKRGEIDIGDVMIGIYGGILSGDGAYDALLHPQIINKLSREEEATLCA